MALCNLTFWGPYSVCYSVQYNARYSMAGMDMSMWKNPQTFRKDL